MYLADMHCSPIVGVFNPASVTVVFWISCIIATVHGYVAGLPRYNINEFFIAFCMDHIVGNQLGSVALTKCCYGGIAQK